jgi:fatty acid desaturase
MASNSHTNANTTADRDTGLLTRWVPERLKHSALYRWLLRLTRVLQFLSSVISLGLFSQRFYKVYRLVNSIKTSVGVNHAFGAVEGILAAAVAYTLIAMILNLLLKGGGPRWLRWLWVLLDTLFVGAFIAVAVLTSPDGGSAGPRHCYRNRDATNSSNLTGQTASNTDSSCNLPWGTFILAIIST